MKRTILVTVAVLVSAFGVARAVDVSGSHENPNQEFGAGTNYRLTGDTMFGWRTAVIAGDINLNGHALTMETGGGNQTVFSGAISGSGSLTWVGGGVPQVCASTLAGDKPNTYSGVTTLAHGELDLDKPAGVDAIPRDLVVGTADSAIIRLVKPNQINDKSRVTLGPKGVVGIELQGHEEKFASLTVTTHAVIDMGDKPASLAVGDSSDCAWDLTKTVTVRRFKPASDKLVFGDSAKGLSPAQLARVGFLDPAGMAPGLYAAKIGDHGQLSPNTLVAAVNPPFDISPQARAARATIYEVPGLANLTGAGSPLRDGMTIDFFGDSITWLNGYIATMDQAIKKGRGTAGKKVKLINRGINGGGVLQVRDGSDKAAYPGDSAQKAFAEVIAADKADVAVVYIGVNDVWWRNTQPEVFEKALRDIVASARANHTTLVLATLSVHGELPDGKNPEDARLDAFAQLTRKVAADTGTTLVDLRKIYLAYEQNNNAQLRVDGTLYSAPSHVLTYDTVHPNDKGVALLANCIAQGIVEALTAKPAATQGPRDRK